MAEKIEPRLENYVQSRPEEEVRFLQLGEHVRMMLSICKCHRLKYRMGIIAASVRGLGKRNDTCTQPLCGVARHGFDSSLG
jgi:hypothetical protein